MSNESSMQSRRILWTKNIRPLNGEHEAYKEPEGENWKLAFSAKASQVNLERTTTGDLILLRQKGKLTHIVEVLDSIPETKSVQEWPWVLNVKSIWHRCLDKAPRQEEIFQTKINLQGGKIVSLAKVVSLKNAWEDKGGIPGLQQHLARILPTIPN